MHLPRETDAIPVEQTIDQHQGQAPDSTMKISRLSIHWKLLAVMVFCNLILSLVWIPIDRSITSPIIHMPVPNIMTVIRQIMAGNLSNDSLGPMLTALHLLEQNPASPVYQTVFFQNHVKFQYPLTSLLPYYGLQRLGVTDAQLYTVSGYVTLFSYLAVVLMSIALALRFSKATGGHSRTASETCAIVLATGIGGLLFLPLLTSYALGQIQTILTLGFTIAFYCWMTGRHKLAGAIMGLMVMVKPQYGVFLLWALLRKKYSAAVAGLVCALSGTLVSCIYFGLHSNLEYFRVLQFIGARGESYRGNQSVNGLLNRLLFNGPNLVFSPTDFPQYNSLVYTGTLATTLLFFALAIFYPWGKQRRGGLADFSCIVLISTLASPVAWNHHYAILLPIFVWLWFSDYSTRRQTHLIWLFAIAYLLVSNPITPMTATAFVPVLNILQSYMFFGVILTLILLLKSRPYQSTDRTLAAK